MDFISDNGIQRNVNLDAPTLIEGFHSSLFGEVIQVAAAISISFKFLFNRIAICVFLKASLFPKCRLIM